MIHQPSGRRWWASRASTALGGLSGGLMAIPGCPRTFCLSSPTQNNWSCGAARPGGSWVSRVADLLGLVADRYGSSSSSYCWLTTTSCSSPRHGISIASDLLTQSDTFLISACSLPVPN